MDKETEEKLIALQVRNAAILETILQTQIRILSKVKKENYQFTKQGVENLVVEKQKEILASLNIDTIKNP